MRVRDFEDPAEEDQERIEGERRDELERSDRSAEKGPALHWYWEAVRHQHRPAPQED